MNKLNYLFITAVFLMISVAASAQGGGFIDDILNRDRSLSTSFLNGMNKTGEMFDCDPWEDEGDCTDLEDQRFVKSPKPAHSIPESLILQQ